MRESISRQAVQDRIDKLREMALGLLADRDEKQHVAMALLRELEEGDAERGRRWRDAYSWLTAAEEQE